MLCLTRKINESVVIDGGIEVKVLRVTRGRVLLGFTAPENTNIMRKEIEDQEYEDNVELV